jgi:hypothetical protein
VYKRQERGLGIERQVKVTLENISPNFVVELSDPDKRVLQCNLAFRMECNFYKPQLPIGKPIKRITTRLGVDISGRNSPRPVVKGDTISVFSLPDISGSGSYLDMDKKIWSYVEEFDQNTSEYMGWEYHDDISPENPVLGESPNIQSPNDVEEDYYLYDTPDSNIQDGLNNKYNN